MNTLAPSVVFVFALSASALLAAVIVLSAMISRKNREIGALRGVQLARDESERRFRTTFNSGFQFLLLLDAEGRVLEVNHAALERANAKADSVIGRPLHDVLWWAGENVDTTLLCENIRAASAGRPVHYEEEIPAGGDAVMMLEVAIKPVEGVRGGVSQLLLEARDVSVRRRIDAALQGLDTLAAMGGIAARVAHEINNPLAGIQYSFLLIKDSVPKDHKHYGSVAAIEREIGRIAGVTRQLYETYRPEKDASPNASLSAIIGDAVAFMEQANRPLRVRVVTDLAGTPSIIALPGAVLRPVIYSLVENALHASPEDGTVLVTARVSDRVLDLRVADNGPGVAPELRHQIFEPSFSVNDTRYQPKGLGLGLALVKKTITSAGGTIRVDTAVNGGAEFIISLPLSQQRMGV